MELPAGAKLEEIPYKNFNHLDFLVGLNSKPLIYDKILKLIPYYIKKETNKRTQETLLGEDLLNREELIKLFLMKKLLLNHN